jgi:predicted outer membrane lipoprotein
MYEENTIFSWVLGFLILLFLFGVIPALIFRQVDKFKSCATIVYQSLEEYRQSGRVTTGLFDSYFEKYLEFKEKDG